MKQKVTITKYVSFFGALFAFLVAPVVFAYEAAPYSSTLPPTFLTEKGVQLNGRVSPNGMLDTYGWFEWGIVGRSDVYETAHRHFGNGNSQINTKATLTGLAPVTQYFYRAVSENGRGRSIGATTYFTTKTLPSILAPIAIVTTNDAVSVSDTNATLRAYVSPHGNSGTKIWFEWGATAAMENKTSTQGSGGNSTTISVKLNNLIPGSVYYFRAVAENSQGRSHGALKVFSTTGVALLAQSLGETPRDQYVPSPVSPTQDTVSRRVTTEGTAAGPPPRLDTNDLPQLQSQNRPGDFFSMLFGGEKTVDTPPADIADTANSGGGGTNEVAGVGASGVFGNLLNMLTGKKQVEVVVEKVGPTNITMHTPVEYRVAYAYRQKSTASDAKLKITLPGDVIYIGDNTNNELLLDTGSGSERTYVLPLGRLENGSTRTMSILGMTTGDATGFPDVRVRLEYTDKNGARVVLAKSEVLSDVKENSASVASARIGILPSSFLGWIVYVLLVVAAILGIRKAKEYYVKRKELLARVEEKSDEQSPSRAPQFLPGAEEVATS